MLEVELEHILGDPDTTHTLCLQRTMSSLQRRLGDQKAGEYTDVHAKYNDQLDTDMCKRMEQLRGECTQNKVQFIF